MQELLVGLLVGLIIIVCWFIWAYFNRYSDERIKSRIISLLNKGPNHMTKDESQLYRWKVDIASHIDDHIAAIASLDPLPATKIPAPRGPYQLIYQWNDLDL